MVSLSNHITLATTALRQAQAERGEQFDQHVQLHPHGLTINSEQDASDTIDGSINSRLPAGGGTATGACLKELHLVKRPFLSSSARQLQAQQRRRKIERRYVKAEACTGLAGKVCAVQMDLGRDLQVASYP